MSEFRSVDETTTQRNWAVAVYVLYLLSLVTGITSLIGVIMAHVKVNESGAVWRSHFAFQIRTFWWSVLATLIGVVLCVTVILLPIGLLLFFLVGVWFVVRSVIGLIKAVDGRPIPAPHSLLFGV